MVARARLALTLGGLVAAALVASAPARAEPLTQKTGGADAGTGTGTESNKEAGRGEIGAGVTGMIGNGGSVASFGGGLDVWYRPFEYVAFGAEFQRFFNDNGADPQYCYGCVSNGTFATAFVEGRLVPGAIVSPFLRVGVGAGSFTVRPEDPSASFSERTEALPVFAVAAGPQLTLGPVFLRVRGTLTATAPSTYVGLGAELGAVF